MKLASAALRPPLVLAAAALLVAPAAARDHGRPRDVGTIDTIVIHTVGGPSCILGKVRFRPVPFRVDDAAFWRDALRSAPVADAHVVIGRRGAVEQVMPLSEVANHTVGANPTSIGIELVHRGDGVEPFQGPQIEALVGTVRGLRRRFPRIALAGIVRHSDLDQRTCSCAGTIYRRRQDPGANFPLNEVIAAVRQPEDARQTGPSAGSGAFGGLTGPAPPTACPIF